MNKKILSAFIAITILIPVNAFALTKPSLKNATGTLPTLAILDTAIDNTIPAIKEKLIYEVCILEWETCPNGKSFMEGSNAATLPYNSIIKNGFDHGTQMTSAAIQSNPNMNIVFIRIIGQNINGDRQISGEAAVYNALDWVISNKDRFNIKAVSMSQGHNNLLPFKQYCPITKATSTRINTLLNLEIPVFLASGNSYSYERINWPSCLPESISVGGATKNGIEIYSNYDKNLLDFHANSRLQVFAPGGKIINASGTSIATQVAAANWISLKQAKPNLTYSQIYSLLQTTAKDVKGRQGSGKMINLSAALNG